MNFIALVVCLKLETGVIQVSKLGKLKYKNESQSVQDVKAHDLRQMFLAMTHEADLIVINPSSCISSLVYCLRSENIDSVNSSDVLGTFVATDLESGENRSLNPLGPSRGAIWFGFVGLDRAAKKKTAIALAEVERENVVDFIADELVKKQLSVVFLNNVDMTDIVTQHHLYRAITTGILVYILLLKIVYASS
uniref:Double Clp-N motif-containing protein n=1 Tax=Tanacetum cinerariifolium TaxID=118510 RepID=A0A699HIY0_TANCI|nr:double Clp-N motif-containing protein [Tanacetum cinerariifolium]